MKIPTHMAIILDGNGRWATRQGKKRTEGHYAGYQRLKKSATYILSKGVKYLSVFAFSTENFKRTKDEVDYLMNLFITSFKKEISFFNENNIKVVFSGRKEPLSDKVYESMKYVEEKTKTNNGGIFNVCLNYGGQAEIVDASKRIATDIKNNIIREEEVNEETFYKYLYNNLPPVDLMVRTSGEVRISNFMLYSISYAELIFTDVCFPDFDEAEVDKCFLEYSNRNITKGTNVTQ